jgi:hypothetical protein
MLQAAVGLQLLACSCWLAAVKLQAARCTPPAARSGSYEEKVEPMDEETGDKSLRTFELA